MLSGRGLCNELITRPEESYRLCCVVVCDLENRKNEEAMTHVGSQRHSKKKIIMGLDSSVDIATRYRLDNSGVRIPEEARFFAPVQTGPGAHPAAYTMSTWSFPGVKVAGA